MGFDPCLVPAFIKPIVSTQEENSSNTQWDELRVSSLDFIPASTCNWLYKSLKYKETKREAIFANLLKGIRSCWPIKT